jgi:hypothetical protein
VGAAAREVRALQKIKSKGKRQKAKGEESLTRAYQIENVFIFAFCLLPFAFCLLIFDF